MTLSPIFLISPFVIAFFSFSKISASEVLFGHLDCAEGTCRCLDATGQPMMETARDEASGLPHCKACKRTRDSLEEAGLLEMTGMPECTRDGFYKRVQCVKSQGKCYCAHQVSGSLLDDVRYGPNPDKNPYCEEHVAQTTAPVAARTSNGKVKIVWNNTVSATRSPYLLYYSARRNAPASRWSVTIIPVNAINEQTGASATLENFLPDSRNYWIRLRAVSTTGKLGPLSAKGRISRKTVDGSPPQLFIDEVKRTSDFQFGIAPALKVSWTVPKLLDSDDDPKAWEVLIHLAEGKHEGNSLPESIETIYSTGEDTTKIITYKSLEQDYTVWIQARNVAGEGPLSDPVLVPGTSLAQCSSLTGDCYCVDHKTREPIAGSARARGSGIPACYNCFEELERHSSGHPVARGNIPNCTDDGTYALKQCASPNWFCVCVNQVTGTHNGASFLGEELDPQCEPPTEAIEIASSLLDSAIGKLIVTLSSSDPTVANYRIFYTTDGSLPLNEWNFVYVPLDYLTEETAFEMSEMDSDIRVIRVQGISLEGYLGPISEPNDVQVM